MNFMNRAQMFRQVSKLLERISANLTRMSPFVFVNLGNMSEEPITEREALVTTLAFVELLLFVNAHNMLI